MLPPDELLETFQSTYVSLPFFQFSRIKKQVSFKLKVVFSTNFRPKTKQNVRAIFEKNIKVSDFGLIWRPFCEYLQIKNFFQKSSSVTFPPIQFPNLIQKIRKILRVVSEKTTLPTNQPTNQLPTTPILQDLADAVPIKVFHTYFHTCYNTLLLILYIYKRWNILDSETNIAIAKKFS